jgi:4-amino-4-deoxy-L-arabinose transferase-like glycosyltransferase
LIPRSSAARHPLLKPLAVILLGFALRTVNLGAFDFWFDEVGQVLAGRSSSPVEAIQVAAAHLGAAPLDYLVTWAGVRILGESEFGLRWITVCWATLTLALMYATGERIQRGIGAWAALLAALSPLATRYAQEVRFYALSLMLCALVLWIGVRWQAWGRGWSVAMAACMTLGLYAHAYTALVWPFVGWVLIVLAEGARRRVLAQFILAAAFALLCFSPWLFGELLTERLPIFADAAGFNLETARRVLAGWEMPNFSPVAPRNTADQPLPYLIGGLHLAALLGAVRRVRTTSLWLGTLVIYGLATLMVVVNDMRVGYFFAPRQILNLLLLRAMFGGWVLRQLAELAQRRLGRPAGLILASVVLVLSIPSLLAYYSNWRDKSNAGQVAALIAEWKPQHLWIAPAYDQLTINYYLERRGYPPPAWHSLPNAQDAAPTLREALRADGLALVALQAAYVEPELLLVLREAGFIVAWPEAGVTGNEHFVVFARR